MIPELMSPDSVDLQVEYWLAGPRLEHYSEKADRSNRKEVKCSLKTAFRSVQVFRPNNGGQSAGLGETTALSMIIVTREKKQKSKLWKKIGIEHALYAVRSRLSYMDIGSTLVLV